METTVDVFILLWNLRHKVFEYWRCTRCEFLNIALVFTPEALSYLCCSTVPTNLPFLKVFCDNRHITSFFCKEEQNPEKLPLLHIWFFTAVFMAIWIICLFIITPTFVFLHLLTRSWHTPELMESLEYGRMVSITKPLHKKWIQRLILKSA